MKLGSDPRDWQPFTFRGVAALACGAPRRLFKVQLLAALWLVGSLVWFLATAWWPVITAAAEQLPPQATIRNRRLNWSGPNSAPLGENRHLAIVVDLERNSARMSTSDLQFKLTPDEFEFQSLFGTLALPYPPGYVITLDRLEFQAWWGAWRLPLLAVSAGIALGFLFAGWFVFAAVCAVWVWVFGFFADRAATPQICWRLAAAAQAPSVLLVGAAIFLYGLERLSLVGLLFALAVQLVVGWVYLFLAPFWLPRHPRAAQRSLNPFRHLPGG